MTTKEILCRAAAQKTAMAILTTAEKNHALESMAASLVAHTAEILAANAEDEAAAAGKITPVMLDRLHLDAGRVEAMADGIRALVALPDPVGRKLEEIRRPNGMVIEKVAVPLGVVAIIYESRPNVTADAAALCFKSGNACILRVGKEAYASAHAIVRALRLGLEGCGIDPDAVQILTDTSHDGANELMTAVGMVDLLIPRGGARLIDTCVKNALVPCIQTGTGICHIYVDDEADQDMALDILENAKTSRPSVCNAAEVCLVHRDIAAEFLPKLQKRLAKVALRPDGTAAKILGLPEANPEDFDTEFLDYILAVAVVDDAEAAISHIAAHSTHHSDCIITENKATANRFRQAVDSAAVYWNVSTRFTDGGEFGLGCEMGISTQKLHARGPMGLAELTTYKYLISGRGQIR